MLQQSINYIQRIPFLKGTGLDNAKIAIAPGLPSAHLLGKIVKANFNITTDNKIPIEIGRTYIVTQVLVTNASISLTTAAGGLYTAVSKGGSAIVAAAQVYSALTAATKFVNLTLAAIAGTDVRTEAFLYLNLTTAQGAAATADVYIFGQRLN